MKAVDVEFVPTGLGVLAVITREDGKVDTQQLTIEEFERLRAEVDNGEHLKSRPSWAGSFFMPQD